MDSCLPGLDFGLVCVPYLRIHVGKFLQQGRLLLRDPEIGEGGDFCRRFLFGTTDNFGRISGLVPGHPYSRILRHLLENYAELATGLVKLEPEIQRLKVVRWKPGMSRSSKPGRRRL